jgi:DNA-binding NtrC family response regulator
MSAFQNTFPTNESSISVPNVSTPFQTSPLEPMDAASVIFTPGTKLREIERIVILETLKQKSFNRTHTARALGIGIRTLQRKLKRYGASDWGLKNWKANA